MRGRKIETRHALMVALGLALSGAACTGMAPASGPLPSGEPVAIAYARATAPVATGAVNTISGERLEEGRAVRMEELLRRVPGLSVTRLGDGRVSVRIRGPHTLIGNAEPLVVIDGMPVEHDSGGLLRDIHPSDVARIEVLKDASSTAIFGARGSAGVIMITTKRAG